MLSAVEPELHSSSYAWLLDFCALFGPLRFHIVMCAIIMAELNLAQHLSGIATTNLLKDDKQDVAHVYGVWKQLQQMIHQEEKFLRSK